MGVSVMLRVPKPVYKFGRFRAGFGQTQGDSRPTSAAIDPETGPTRAELERTGAESDHVGPESGRIWGTRFGQSRSSFRQTLWLCLRISWAAQDGEDADIQAAQLLRRTSISCQRENA